MWVQAPSWAHILPGVYNIYAPYHKRSLMARAFLFFVDQVQSLAHTHVGSSLKSHRGPLFLDKFLTFCFSQSSIGYLLALPKSFFTGGGDFFFNCLWL
jgi:hypothetical protein